MFYTRGVATALIAIRPGDDLRFFNGGRDGATAGDAMTWVDDVASLSKPTVVFLCFGLDDGKNKSGPDAEPLIAEYRRNLGALVDRVKAIEGVRRVVVLSPPAVQAGISESPGASAGDYNGTLLTLTRAALTVAIERQVGFVDLFTPSKEAYLAQLKEGGEPLSLGGGRVPTEEMHVILASVVLRDIGVTGEMLQPTGWSPLVPRHMARVRQAMAIRVKPPTIEQAQATRDLYTSMQKFDEAFFRLWRLSGRMPSAPARDRQALAAEEAWGDVRTATAALIEARKAESQSPKAR
jgi:hypothetical protein